MTLGIQLLDFFMDASDETVQVYNSQVDYRADSVLLIGPGRSSKTTLALQYCIRHVQKSNEPVLFITNRQKLYRSCVHLPLNATADETALDSIFFKYADDEKELYQYLCHMHEFSEYPSLIIVDDLSLYFQTLPHQQKNSSIMRVLGALFHMLGHISKARKEAGKVACRLIATDLSTPDGSQPTPHFYKFWFPMTLKIEGIGNGRYSLKVHQTNQATEDPYLFAATFNCGANGVRFETASMFTSLPSGLLTATIEENAPDNAVFDEDCD